jgi:diguanylate cyclase (GGDEF)-like protein
MGETHTDLENKLAFDQNKSAARVYRAMCSMVCLAIIAMETRWSVSVGHAQSGVGSAAFIYMFVLMIAARYMSFSLGRANFSLDTPILVAAVFHMGPLPAAILILTSQMIYDFTQLLRNQPPFDSEHGFVALFFRLLFSPSVTAFIAFSFGTYFELTPVNSTEMLPAEFLSLTGKVFSVTVCFVVIQYPVVLYAYWLEGRALKTLTKETAIPAMSAELALAPAAVLFVWTLQKNNLFPFLLLGATYLVIADIFNRLARARKKTLNTMAQQERMIQIGERVFAVLSYRQVNRHLVDAIHEEIQNAEMSITGIWDEEEGRFIMSAKTEAGVQKDPDIPHLQQLIDLAIQARTPTVFESRAGNKEIVLPVVPFVLGEQPEGFIAVVLPKEEGRSRNGAGDRALGKLRRLASIAGIAMHNARLYRLATLDGLTGLYVRRFFDRRYSEEISRARRYGKDLSLLLIDLDDFKIVNDTYGHQVGDRVLQAVSNTIQQNVRTADVPCRFGGDEFVVLLPETNLEGASEFAHRLNQKLEGISLLQNGQLIRFTTSIGVTAYEPCRTTEVPDLVKEADEALYDAKALKNKGQVVIKVHGT